jgi:hypothetical protein
MQRKNQNNKTINLSRAILLLAKNANQEIEKTLLTKVETACYDLIDITHNNETKIYSQLKYISDLMLVARQVNIFLEENVIFIMSIISEISKSYETKLETKNEEIINEKIRDMLEGGEMSETENIKTEVNNFYNYKRQDEVKKEIKTLENRSETKINNTHFSNQNVSETKKTESSRFENVLNKNENKITDKSQDRNENVRDMSNNRKLSRKEEVLKTLSSVPVSIKDVAEKVLGCSEKTIQRELNALVDSRLAIRIGEKRWSKYILA